MGIAPRGKRAQVEGSIGTIDSSRYGFTKSGELQLRGIEEVRASCDFGIQHEKNGSSSRDDGAGVMRSTHGKAVKQPRMRIGMQG